MAHDYTALKIQQRPEALPFFLFGADARDLLLWASVPQKKVDLMAGYQRELDERYETIRKFIEYDPKNIVPGAILVAVRSESFHAEEVGDGIYTISIQHDTFDDTTAALRAAFNALYARLDDDEKAIVDAGFIPGEEEVGDGGIEIEGQVPLGDAPEENGNGPIGGRDGGNLLDEAEEDDSGAPSSYLTTLSLELRRAVEAPDTLAANRIEAVNRYADMVAKPGRILDGQHRVFGAKNVNAFEVSFPIVLIPGLSESEQVFHFYVVNNKARPLNATQLRSTVSTSLTTQEIDDLYKRFRDAGVRAEEAQWTLLIDQRTESPFRGLIDFGLQDGEGFISENIMYQLAARFLKMPRKFAALYRGVEAWGPSDAPDYEYRLLFFITFWDTVRSIYSTAWESAIEARGGQIFQKVSMLMLQEFVLERLLAARRFIEGPALGDVEVFRNAIQTTLQDLPSAFFMTEWKVAQLDTTDGRRFFKDQMEKAMSGSQIGRLGLFRENTTI